MKSFLQYYLKREDDEKGLADIDAEPNEDEMLLKAAKLIISRHQERFLDFIKSISKHDDDIKRFLGKFTDKRSNYLPKDLRGARQEDKDIIATNSADSNGPI